MAESEAPSLTGWGAEAARFLRTVLSACFTPGRFLVDWPQRPTRYASPKQLLGLTALLIALSLYTARQLDPTGVKEIEAAIGPSRAGVLVWDAFSALLPALAVWFSVVAILVGARVTRPRSPEALAGWPWALRLAGFLAPLHLLSTLPALAVIIWQPRLSGVTMLVQLPIEAAFMFFGYRRLYRRSPARALAATLIAELISVGVLLVLYALTLLLCVALAHRG